MLLLYPCCTNHIEKSILLSILLLEESKIQLFCFVMAQNGVFNHHYACLLGRQLFLLGLSSCDSFLCVDWEKMNKSSSCHNHIWISSRASPLPKISFWDVIVHHLHFENHRYYVFPPRILEKHNSMSSFPCFSNLVSMKSLKDTFLHVSF